jgi:hypothetical protein
MMVAMAKNDSADKRRNRLAERLRDNLGRRKAQTRARRQPDTDPATTNTPSRGPAR